MNKVNHGLLQCPQIMVLLHFAHIIMFKMLVNFGLQAHIKMLKMLVNLGLQAHAKVNHG